MVCDIMTYVFHLYSESLFVMKTPWTSVLGERDLLLTRQSHYLTSWLIHFMAHASNREEFLYRWQTSSHHFVRNTG